MCYCLDTDSKETFINLYKGECYFSAPQNMYVFFSILKIPRICQKISVLFNKDRRRQDDFTAQARESVAL